MYITAFASISSNRNRGSFDSKENLHHQSGIDVEEKILFRVESHVFIGEEFESRSRLYKIPMTKADLFFRIFEAYPGTLKCFETLYANFRHLIRMHE